MTPGLNLFFTHLSHWHWGILAAGLVILEIFLPFFFFLWLGMAAGIVSGVLFFFPEIGWKAQFLLFSGISVVSVAISRQLLIRSPTQTDRPTLNRRGSQYVGRVFTLTDSIENGVGRIRVDDTTWRIVGQDAAAGCKVKVIGFDGAVLSVEVLET